MKHDQREIEGCRESWAARSTLASGQAPQKSKTKEGTREVH